MKIAVVTYALEVGGVEAFIKHIANYCTDQGHEVVILETLKAGKWSKLFRDTGYAVKQILPRYYNSRIQHAKAIAKFLSGFDLVILNDAPYGQAALGLLNNNIVAIPVLHNDLKSIINNAVANSENWDVLVAVSPKLLTHIDAEFIEKKKAICIPNGVAIQSLEKQYDSVVCSNKPFRLIFIGSMNHAQKGVFYLPEIFSGIASQFPNIQFDLLGDGVDIEELKKRFNCTGKGKVRFHGFVENATALEMLKESDALIMPSHFEGLPIVLLEAMAAGVVPVVSLLAGITDFAITDKEDGRLVSVGDVRGFTDSIVALVSDRDMLSRMSVAARKTAVSRFSYEVMGEKYLDIALELIEKRQVKISSRTGKIDLTLLGDFPYLPLALVRPLRKIQKLLGLYRQA